MTPTQEDHAMDRQSIVVTLSLKEFVQSTVATASKEAAKEAISEHLAACEFHVRKDEILGVGKDLQSLKVKFYAMVAMISVAGGATGSMIGKLLA